ncbi:MAG: hypothetical protein G8D24_00450 [Buchnera aphidicola (Periphyllus lyropictus)]|nr:hypothetical protein [Buchnera aphidicola (Periphyllus lyropictus)]
MKKICYIIKKKPLKNIFLKEIIILPEKKISEYIKKIFIKNLGIFSNISFFTEEKFIYYILEKKIFKKKYNRFNESLILWKLMNLSEKTKKKFFFKKNEIELIQFKYFKNLSNIFYQYLIYRPDWINNYKKKKNNDINYSFQEKIWNKIFNKNKNFHYSNLLKNFLLDKNLKIFKNFPSRIFIFNPYNYPISYFKILKKISKKIDVYFLICTPFSKNSIKNKNWEKDPYISHWNKNNLKILKYIYSFSNVIKTFYIKNNSNNLLNNIKKNIFYLKHIKRKKKKEDQSISFHICNNYLREIEILHNNILNELNKNKKIQPKDIIVKTNNIQTYVPYINSIFYTNIKKHNIPYNIYKKKMEKNDSILYIFNKILSLNECKFKKEKILDFLNFKCISKKFLISQKEIKIIKKWTEDTNIRWGINSKHKKKLKIFPTFQNTWDDGIKKIILGYGIKKNNKLWKKIYPYSIHDKKQIKTLEKFIFFLSILKKWKKKLSTKKKCKSWIKIFNEIIYDFFYLNKKNKKKIKFIKKNWKNLLKNIKKSSYKKRISIIIIKYEINKKIKKFYIHKKFNNNSITFSNFNILRTIEFKITFIIGMNENIFPKKIVKKSDNLINYNNRFGDLKINQNNYYIFLELIYFTKKKIHISYINNDSIKNNEPSIVINQLKKYIKNNFFYKKKKKKEIKINIFKYPQEIFQKTNFFFKDNRNNFNKNWILKKNKIKEKTKKFLKKIPLIKKIKKIKINKLILFWKNPILYFFNKILNIYYNKNEITGKNNEPFYIDIKNHYLLNKKILKSMIFKKDIHKFLINIKSSGILPHGNLGTIYLNNQIKKIKKIWKKIKNLKTNFKNKKINFFLKNYNIYGNLKNISKKKGIVKWTPFNINNFNKINLWIKHLIYCINKGKSNSYYIGSNKSVIFKNIKKNVAKKYLLKFILGYINGLKKPILLTKTGLNWFHYMYDKKKKKLFKNKEKINYGKKKIIETWNGNKYSFGDKKNLYIKKIINKLNKNSIKKICRISKYWMHSIYKNIL